jgi:hypothetical protein
VTSARKPFAVEWASSAKRALPKLPEKVAAAAIEFIYGPLAESPTRVGAGSDLNWKASTAPGEATIASCIASTNRDVE